MHLNASRDNNFAGYTFATGINLLVKLKKKISLVEHIMYEIFPP